MNLTKERLDLKGRPKIELLVIQIGRPDNEVNAEWIAAVQARASKTSANILMLKNYSITPPYCGRLMKRVDLFGKVRHASIADWHRAFADIVR